MRWEQRATCRLGRKAAGFVFAETALVSLWQAMWRALGRDDVGKGKESIEMASKRRLLGSGDAGGVVPRREHCIMLSDDVEGSTEVRCPIAKKLKASVFGKVTFARCRSMLQMYHKF